MFGGIELPDVNGRAIYWQERSDIPARLPVHDCSWIIRAVHGTCVPTFLASSLLDHDT